MTKNLLIKKRLQIADGINREQIGNKEGTNDSKTKTNKEQIRSTIGNTTRNEPETN
jgi:hypothetical protein